jgi:hypothetical protein
MFAYNIFGYAAAPFLCGVLAQHAGLRVGFRTVLLTVREDDPHPSPPVSVMWAARAAHIIVLPSCLVDRNLTHVVCMCIGVRCAR